MVEKIEKKEVNEKNRIEEMIPGFDFENYYFIPGLSILLPKKKEDKK